MTVVIRRLLALMLLGDCSAQPQSQSVRVEAEPSDAVCSVRQGERVLDVNQADRRVTVQVLPTPLSVECRRVGYETATVRKYLMQHNSVTASPVLLLLDSGTFQSDSYPPVVRVTLERSTAGG